MEFSTQLKIITELRDKSCNHMLLQNKVKYRWKGQYHSYYSAIVFTKKRD